MGTLGFENPHRLEIFSSKASDDTATYAVVSELQSPRVRDNRGNTLLLGESEVCAIKRVGVAVSFLFRSPEVLLTLLSHITLQQYSHLLSRLHDTYTQIVIVYTFNIKVYHCTEYTIHNHI